MGWSPVAQSAAANYVKGTMDFHRSEYLDF